MSGVAVKNAISASAVDVSIAGASVGVAGDTGAKSPQERVNKTSHMTV